MRTLKQKYFTRVFVPPAILFLPLSALFLSQVIQLSASKLGLLIAIMLGVYLSGNMVFYVLMAPLIEKLEGATTNEEKGERASRLLQKSVHVSTALWTFGGVAFAFLVWWTLLPTALGFSYSVTAVLISAFAGVAWCYGATKRTIFESLIGSDSVYFEGRQFRLGRKIALLFIGVFLISSIALVQLVSAKVSTTLERLAIANEEQRFVRLYDDAQIAATIDAEAVDTWSDYVPEGYDVFVVAPDGGVISERGEKLEERTVKQVLQRKTGDSTGFVASDVVRYQQLRNGGVLVLRIPWAPYAALPYQIAYYAAVVVGLTALLFIGATMFLARDISRSVTRLLRLASELAEGRFSRQTSIFSDDEIGELAKSFAGTSENLRRLLGQIGGSGQEITDGVRVIRDGTGSLLERAAEQTSLTSDATEAVINVQAGAQSVLHAAEKVTDLAQDSSARALELQASAEEVARSVEHLFQSVEKTSSSTTEMDASAREMSARTETLSQIGEEVLSFVTEMDSTIEELRGTAETTAEISRRVREDAELGGVAVGETVIGIETAQASARRTAEVLDSLQKSVGQISQIVNVIEEIADRTNLLSLNAAIIAAQAGEHGAGFTVVAGEIRGLADRTRSSTTEIVSIIKKVQVGSTDAVRAIAEDIRRVDQNVGLAQNASESLEKIVSSSSKSFEMATRIAQALEQQAQASSHLHQVTSRMSDHIAEINRATQEQARGTRLLAEEAERVREIASKVRSSTEQQSTTGRGITDAMEQIASDIRHIRDLLEQQLGETERIAGASRTMLEIATANDSVAREFNQTVHRLIISGQHFETEVKRFEM